MHNFLFSVFSFLLSVFVFAVLSLLVSLLTYAGIYFGLPAFIHVPIVLYYCYRNAIIYSDYLSKKESCKIDE